MNWKTVGRNSQTSISVFFIFIMVFVLSPFAYGNYGGGSGTAGNPYLISEAEHLIALTNNSGHWGSSFHFRLTNDIHLGGPISGIDNFLGVFDGNNYSIHNFEPADACDSLHSGLFKEISNGSVMNLTLVNAGLNTVCGPINGYWGLLAGRLNGYGIVSNCHVTGGYIEKDFSSHEYGESGGLIGYVDGDAIVSGCSVVDVRVKGYFAGGIVARSQGTIQDCIVKNIDVEGVYSVGGLVGTNNGTVERCAAEGNVIAMYYGGGLIGLNSGGPVGHIYDPVVRQCYAFCSVSADDNASGLIAGSRNQSLIIECYAGGSVSGSAHKSGLVSCFANYQDAIPIIIDCYSVATVTGNNSGGLINHVHLDGGPVTVKDSFWDIEASGVNYSAGGFGKTTAQMQTKSTFTNAGWSFVHAWYMENYPAFKWELSPLQAQIDAATDDDVIVVQPGVYEGKLYFRGKNITLTSIDPDDPSIVASTVLHGKRIGPVVTFDGTEGANCELAGFTITGGYNTAGGGGVRGNGTHANIANCVITGNMTELSGGGFWVFSGNISNCKITGNSAGTVGGASVGCGGRIENCVISGNTAATCGGMNNSDGEIVNCTIVNNSGGGGGGLRDCDGTITNCIIWGNSSPEIGTSSVPTYSCFVGGSGGGNIDADPNFVSGPLGDYYLSQISAGQGSDSSCVDAGSDTAENLGLTDFTTHTDEVGDGGVVDMGYHFSMISPVDINGDGRVDFFDFAIMSLQWDGPGGVPSADIVPVGGNGVVNIDDLCKLGMYWLWPE